MDIYKQSALPWPGLCSQRAGRAPLTRDKHGDTAGKLDRDREPLLPLGKRRSRQDTRLGPAPPHGRAPPAAPRGCPARPSPSRGGSGPCAHQPVDLHLLDGRVSRGRGFAFALGGAEAAAGSARAFLARRHRCPRTAGKGNATRRKRRHGRGGARPKGPGRNATGRPRGPASRRFRPGCASTLG